MRAKRRGELAAELAAQAATEGDVRYVVEQVGEMGGNDLRELALGVRDRVEGPCVVVLAATNGGKGALVGALSKSLAQSGLSAAEMIKDAAADMGGGGSRDPELAQAGGPDGSSVGLAVETARQAVLATLKGL